MSPVPEHGVHGDIAERATAAARSVPGVAEATVRVRRDRAANPQALTTPAAETPRAAAAGRARLDGGPLVLPADAPATLVDALSRAAATVPDRGTTYVLADDVEDHQTFPQLLTDAARVLSGLRDHGISPGDSVLLHCDDNRNFVTGFWACLLGGFVPTSIGVAPTYRWENATTHRMRVAWELLERPCVLTDTQLVDQVSGLGAQWDTTALRVLGVEQAHAAEPATELHPARPDDAAVHLLTSGSTGVPKCVRHTHRTVITRAYVNAAFNGFGFDDVTLNFMPLDHVAGMVMHNVRDVVLMCRHVNARTDSFIADPLRWLTWIERYRVTNTSGPNFVITLMTRLADEIRRGSWDLSSLRDITNGGEAIVSRTMHEFLHLLAPHGLATDVMRPAWGMSEVCGGMVHSTLRGDDESVGVVTVDGRTLDGPLTVLPGPTPGHPTFTEVGVPIAGTSVRVVGTTGELLPEDHVGRLQVRGVTMMAGYHNDLAATEKAFTDDGWFDTGDLAFVHGGRLVMTGRAKDLIVIRSANYPCHEIESVVERADGVLPTFAAACSEHDPSSGSDELVLFCVLTEQGARQPSTVVENVSALVSKEIGLRPRRVVPVPRERFPKTSAGNGLLGTVASALAEGGTVGWFHGRMEFGPRALGARSILADPRRADMRDRLNSKIKWREEFRPFAPAVLVERAEEFFTMGRTSPFMIDLFKVRRPDDLQAVTHVDGTARVQTVDAAVAPRYHRLIHRFGTLTGVPVLLNTSFNLSDEPVVCAPVDALRTFLRSSLDLLCLEDLLVDAASVTAELRAAAVEEHRFVAGAGLRRGGEIYSFF